MFFDINNDVRKIFQNLNFADICRKKGFTHVLTTLLILRKNYFEPGHVQQILSQYSRLAFSADLC
jgi:hypothetical protein